MRKTMFSRLEALKRSSFQTSDALRRFLALFFVVCFLNLNSVSSVWSDVVTIDFENAYSVLPENCVWHDTTTGRYFRGEDGTESGMLDWSSYEPRYFSLGNGVSFNNVFSTAWQYEYWHGFSFSNKTGFSGVPDGTSSNIWLEDGNQFASYSGGGANGSEYYAVIYDGDACGFSPAPAVSFGESVSVLSFSLNNTPWPVYGALLGDGFAAPAESGFWYRLTVTGKNALGEITGMKDVMLIDYLGDELSFIDDWTTIGLTNLSAADIFTDDSGDYLLGYGNTPDDALTFVELLLNGDVENSFENVNSLEFRVSGTDGSEWGLNIAAYFAIDDLTFLTSAISDVQVPEPGTWALLLIGVVALGVYSSRRKRKSRWSSVMGDFRVAVDAGEGR